MPIRLSQHSKNRKSGKVAFKPDLAEWVEICKVSAYDTQIWRHFMISKETFYAFLDRERYEEEQTGINSAYLDAYKKERARTRKAISDAFLKNVENGDTASIIFGMKTYHGLIESKDIAHIELKKKTIALKLKIFLTNLAQDFDLNLEELEDFAKKYFSDSDLDKI